MLPLLTFYAQEIEIWLKTIHSCYWTGWESLLEIGHGSYCCKRVPENRLVALQTSNILKRKHDPGRISTQHYELFA